MSYRTIGSMGPKKMSMLANPLSYCINNTLESRFNHSGIADSICGQQSRQCQSFLSDYCAQGWDAYCDYAAENKNTIYPNNIDVVQNSSIGLNQGEILVYNTAAKKYLQTMINGKLHYEPFDPTVASSPNIAFWVPQDGYQLSDLVPVYAITNPSTLDSDPVMNKMLEQPLKYTPILLNILNTMRRNGTLPTLNGTRLGTYFSTGQITLSPQA